MIQVQLFFNLNKRIEQAQKYVSLFWSTDVGKGLLVGGGLPALRFNDPKTVFEIWAPFVFIFPIGHVSQGLAKILLMEPEDSSIGFGGPVKSFHQAIPILASILKKDCRDRKADAACERHTIGLVSC